MMFEDMKRRESAVLAQTYARYPVEITRGQGSRCYDGEGRTFIDFTSGIGVNALGFCDPGWTQSVTAQLTTLQHACNLFYTEPMVTVAEMLTARTNMRRVFFANSGAEANEGAIKVARKAAFDAHGKGRSTILTLENSFHGRTVTTLSATGQDVFHNYFFPFTEGFRHVPVNDLAATEAAMTEDVCAIMIEIVQGEGGVVPLDRGYLMGIQKACDERGILLIVDEVQTGMGRTGTLMAYQRFGLTPDIVTVAKGLGGGLPIGAVLLGDKVKDTLGPGTHGTTFGGNPAACAGAAHILSRMDDAFLDGVKKKGARISTQLLEMPGVESVTGLGLMLGVTLERAAAKDVIAECIKRGLLILSAKQKVRLLPPLNIPNADIDTGLAILQDAIAAAEQTQPSK